MQDCKREKRKEREERRPTSLSLVFLVAFWYFRDFWHFILFVCVFSSCSLLGKTNKEVCFIQSARRAREKKKDGTV